MTWSTTSNDEEQLSQSVRKNCKSFPGTFRQLSIFPLVSNQHLDIHRSSNESVGYPFGLSWLFFVVGIFWRAVATIHPFSSYICSKELKGLIWLLRTYEAPFDFRTSKIYVENGLRNLCSIFILEKYRFTPHIERTFLQFFKMSLKIGVKWNSNWGFRVKNII